MNRLIVVLIVCLISSANVGCLDDIFNEDEDGYNSIETGLTKQCINYDSKERCWLLLVPGNLTMTDSIPLVIDMHGIGGNMYLQHNLTRFANISEEYGVYIAYPQGYDNELSLKHI